MTLVVPMVRIRLKCADVAAFVARYHGDVNPAGIFVRTRSPLPAGTPVSFDFRLADDSCLFRGSGVVVWARPDDTLAPLLDAGMMLGFEELRDGTDETFARVLAHKRSMDEAADTVPTLVRTFAGERGPLPMTTKMTADELGELRARVRSEMLAEGAAPVPPMELAVETPAAPPSAVLPPATMVPSPAREHVEARPLLSPPPSAPLAKILVLRPQPLPSRPKHDTDDVTPLPPVARISDLIDATPRTDVTALVATPHTDRTTRLMALALVSWFLLFGLFAVIRLHLVQRMLEWLSA